MSTTKPSNTIQVSKATIALLVVSAFGMVLLIDLNTYSISDSLATITETVPDIEQRLMDLQHELVTQQSSTYEVNQKIEHLSEMFILISVVLMFISVINILVCMFGATYVSCELHHIGKKMVVRR